MKFKDINLAILDEMKLDPGLVTDTERVRFINDAMSDIDNLQIVELTKTDSAAHPQYPTLPTGLSKLHALYWNNVPLLKLDASKDLTSTGTPIGYILEAGTIRLFPAPTADGVLRWTYTGTATPCTTTDVGSSATSVPTLPEAWHTLLIDYACYRSHRKNGNVLMAAQYKKDYTQGVATNLRACVSALNSQIIDSSVPEKVSDSFYGY